MEEKFRAFKEQEHSRQQQHDGIQRNIATDEQSLVKLLNEIGDQLTLNAKDANNMNGVNGRVFAKNDLDNHRYNSRDVANNGTQSQAYRPPKSAVDNKKRQQMRGNISSRKSQQSQPLNRYRSQSVDYDALGCVFDIDIDNVVDNTNTNEYNNYSPFSDEELDEDVIEFDDDDDDLNIDSRNNRRNITQQQSIQTETQPINPNAQQNAQNRHLMAFSLPIQVPQWRTISHYQYDDDDYDDEDKKVSHVKGENIAESIQQLAKSVWNDSDDVLRSARPSRRFNTGDLFKSRPQL